MKNCKFVMKFCRCVHILLLLLSPLVAAGKRKGLVTLFDDNYGATGISLWKYPIRAGSKKLYPVAVYADNVSKYKYRILKIQVGKKSIFGHVVDECPKSVSTCRKNHKKAQRKGAMLIDVHQSAWNALNVNMNTGIFDAKFHVVGKKILRAKYVDKKWT